MKQQNRNLGKFAEDLAAKELYSKGYQILEQNFSNKFGEIDIIAKEGNTLVFVEVKAKTGEDFGLPEEMINKGKLSRVRHMAMVYLDGKEADCRIDVVAVVLDKESHLTRLTHYQNVY